MADDIEMTEVDTVPATQSTAKAQTDRELAEQYPNRPFNHSKTLPFHDLFLTLFNPLQDNRKRPTGPASSRRKQGPHGPHAQSPNEIRRALIERFINRWRKEVGNDIHPALRLIIPDKDRERAMYGLKETAIAKLLIRVMKIDKDSEDGFNLRNWKSAGVKSGSAGDFAARCFEVLNKRPMRTEVGDMTITEVNDMLDRLSVASKEDQQFPIFQDFYQRMNPEELMWLVRMILRQMKVGATEKTILEVWHPDAETLFSVSSNLRRVCWELWDRNYSLTDESSDISLMQCFQPQLAQFQMNSFEKIVKKMRLLKDDDKFWVEEKLDGERMQLHMTTDPKMPGGKRFNFWSRKAKDYTYLYGKSLQDENSALTRHLKDAFNPSVQNLILDGEMITWDPKIDKIVGFGSLKTAALDQQKNPRSDGPRPLYRVFDILYLNGTSLTGYPLEERRNALNVSMPGCHRRMEVHGYTEASTAAELDPLLQEVVSKASEGLVVKNPRSAYRLNERNDDWIKIKPEYMTGHGAEFDCIVIGGYYGSGRRGGNLSSFLCGLTPRQHELDAGVNPQKCVSFFKVGGGFSAADYAEVRHKTEGKWHKFDPNRPPTDWVVLGMTPAKRLLEVPDEWIKPEDSIVVMVKAASIHTTPQFATTYTLRFPRFVKIRSDKDWKTAMSHDEFLNTKHEIDQEQQDGKKFVYDSRRKKTTRTTKKQLVIAGQDMPDNEPAFEQRSSTKIFDGVQFFVMTNALKADGKTEEHSKAYIEKLVKSQGATITQSATGSPNTICVADRGLVSVTGLKKKDTKTIIRPSWIFDCVRQAEIDIQLGRSPLLLPYEPRHIYSAKSGDEDLTNTGIVAVTGGISHAADEFDDSFAKDIDSVEEMRLLLKKMPTKFEDDFNASEFTTELEEHGYELSISGMFANFNVFFDTATPDDLEVLLTSNIVRFAGGQVAADLRDLSVTHIVLTGNDASRTREVRKQIASRRKLPHLVTLDWINDSWTEGTLLDEERFVPR